MSDRQGGRRSPPKSGKTPKPNQADKTTIQWNDDETSINPAFHIPLSDEELKALGELAAILGQIEWLMQLTVSILMGTTVELAQKLLGSTSIQANFNIWLSVIKEKSNNKLVVNMAVAVVDRLAEITEGRNDFFHAYFANATTNGLFVLQKTLTGDVGPVVAVRVRNSKATPLAKLHTIRNRAAQLSRYVGYIYWAGCGPSANENWQRADGPPF
jgi:hypothetical protein